MTDNYAKIVQDNLNKLYGNLPKDLAKNLPGEQNGKYFAFNAFGEKCLVEPEGITLGDEERSSVFGILISLYALNACPDICVPKPLKAFREFPDSMPYVGAFTTHTEHLLVPHVAKIEKAALTITEALNGEGAPAGTGGDFSFIVYPLPKIALCYIFYKADDDFPASVTCLYSNNAQLFLPVDGLADVGEYCSKKILELIE
ncbi:MAG: DUF3786 domain-containing protein [Proteobacteria bacterium]|nr:DUF3786 domain-containing protein [Pseudomonadota bacterium]MBU1397641.1 DUF3786 domain-containing protein [Pseudomonadota bacterium]MBU1571374.1 DUF3786 domain-containing protein [Pseudomonadota bacterium]